MPEPAPKTESCLRRLRPDGFVPDRLEAEAAALFEILERNRRGLAAGRLPTSGRSGLLLLGSLLDLQARVTSRAGEDLPGQQALLGEELAAAVRETRIHVELWHARRSRLLEWIIIGLIAFDVALSLA